MFHRISNDGVDGGHPGDAIRGLDKAIAAGGEGDPAQPDPARVCAEVRAVASEVYRAKKKQEGDGQATSRDWERLEGRIDHLQGQLEALGRDHELRLDELLRWLTNLRRLVQTHGKA